MYTQDWIDLMMPAIIGTFLILYGRRDKHAESIERFDSTIEPNIDIYQTYFSSHWSMGGRTPVVCQLNL